MNRRVIALLFSIGGLLLMLSGIGALAWAMMGDVPAEERSLIAVVAVFAAVVGLLLEAISRIQAAIHDLEDRLAQIEGKRTLG